MTTAGVILQDAIREGNLVPAGASLTAPQQTEALRLFNNIVLSAFSILVGERLRDWQAPVLQNTGGAIRDFPLLPGARLPLHQTFPDSVPPNARIVWGGSEQFLYATPSPQDGACLALIPASGAALAATPGTLTIDGNGRKIGGQDQQVYTSLAVVPSGLRWFYRADLGDWVQIAAIGIDDECLFPVELDDFWVCATAIRLAPRYGKVVAPSTVARSKEMTTTLMTRYAQSAPTTSGFDQIRPTAESFGQQGNWMRQT